MSSARSKPRVAIVTGAAGGIGRATRYASPPRVRPLCWSTCLRRRWTMRCVRCGRPAAACLARPQTYRAHQKSKPTSTRAALRRRRRAVKQRRHRGPHRLDATYQKDLRPRHRLQPQGRPRLSRRAVVPRMRQRRRQTIVNASPSPGCVAQPQRQLTRARQQARRRIGMTLSHAQVRSRPHAHQR